MVEFERSGMTRMAFCRAQGKTPHTLDYYRQKHGKREQQGTARLLPIELVNPLPSGGSCLRVELANGRRIAVTEGFDAIHSAAGYACQRCRIQNAEWNGNTPSCETHCLIAGKP